MSDIETTTPCARCGFRSTDYRAYIVLRNGNNISWVCQGNDACKRRQKRNKIIAEMTEKAMKPARNRTNDILLGTVLACGLFLGSAAAMGISWLISRSGF